MTDGQVVTVVKLSKSLKQLIEKSLHEEMLVNENFYSEDRLSESMETDMISAEEMGFMVGFICG